MAIEKSPFKRYANGEKTIQLHVDLENRQYITLRSAIKFLGFRTVSEWVRSCARAAIQEARCQGMFEHGKKRKNSQPTIKEAV